jgi:oxygen-dependent protoporphyrinogen oxidase
MTPEARRFAVVGAGIAGLAAAHRLCELCAERGIEPSIALLEASERLGGLIRTERAGESLVEGGPDSFLTAKPGGVELCHRLGLGGELMHVDGGAGGTRILIGGRFYDLPAGFLMMAPTRLWPLVRSPLFSPAAKLRMVLERFVPKAHEPDESLASFVTRRFGREVLERSAEPVLASIFMADAERVSAAAVLPRFVEMERAFGSVTRGVRRSLGAAPGQPLGGGGFAYLRGGTSRIVERLVERLPPGVPRTGVALSSLERDGEGGWRIRLSGGATDVVADAVVLACPAYASAAAVAALDPALSGEIGRQEYASCATVSLSYREEEIRRPLPGFGFFVPRNEGLELVAASFTSVKFPGRWPAGEVLLRCFVGGALHPALAELAEPELARLAHDQLRSILDIRGEPRFARVIRSPRSMPQYEVGFPQRVRSIGRRLAAHAGLFLAGSSVGAFGLPDCIRSGEQAAEGAARFVAGREG